jgi:hypothetical protein
MRLCQRQSSTISRGVALLVTAIVTSGCGLRYLGNPQALLTTAENRTVVARPYPTMMITELIPSAV